MTISEKSHAVFTGSQRERSISVGLGGVQMLLREHPCHDPRNCLSALAHGLALQCFKESTLITCHTPTPDWGLRLQHTFSHSAVFHWKYIWARTHSLPVKQTPTHTQGHTNIHCSRDKTWQHDVCWCMGSYCTFSCFKRETVAATFFF